MLKFSSRAKLFYFDHVSCHKKMEPDRFSQLDVYWVQTTDKHTEKQKYVIENTKKRFESEN